MSAQFVNRVKYPPILAKEPVMKLIAHNLDIALKTVEEERGWHIDDIAIVRMFNQDGWTWHISFDEDEDAFKDLDPQSLKDGAELLEMVKELRQ